MDLNLTTEIFTALILSELKEEQIAPEISLAFLSEKIAVGSYWGFETRTEVSLSFLLIHSDNLSRVVQRLFGVKTHS